MLPEPSSCPCVQLMSLPLSVATLLPSSLALWALRGRRLSHPLQYENVQQKACASGARQQLRCLDSLCN